MSVRLLITLLGVLAASACDSDEPCGDAGVVLDAGDDARNDDGGELDAGEVD